MRILALFSIIFFALTIECIAQTTNDTVLAPGSSMFKLNKSRSFWMGSNYRKEWTTPIKVPVIDLSKEKGGLIPVKRGGGKQTRSLRLTDPTGREYNFRSIQKFITSKTLPADLQSEAAEDIVADGVSASYPYAALSMQSLAEAAGVPYLPAKVVYIPDNSRLGQYKDDFKNLIAYLEQRLPDSVKKGYDTEEVVEKLKEDNDNSADQMALLKVRILDMFVMDFDRHEGQWLWGSYDKEKGKMFYPIPKDRDQAFYINRGIFPHIIQWNWLVPQLEGLKPKAKNIRRFNFASRNLDRFFLNRLSKNDWQSAVDKFLPMMTDAVIEKALAQQPPEIRNIDAGKIVSVLKERRNYLAEDIMDYYRFLDEIVDITASDKSELFYIDRNNDGSVLVQVYKINKEGDDNKKLYERLFDPADTKELRLYGFGGNDRFVIKGTNNKIKIRMIGGNDADVFENTASPGKRMLVYDTKDGNNQLNGKFVNKLSKDTIVNSYNPIYYKYNQVIPFLSFGFNPDDGIYIGGFLKIIRHGFRKSPYKSSHTITANHSLASGAFNFRYNAEFIGVFGRRSDLLIESNFNAPAMAGFFGFGASSIYDKSKPGKFRYYWTRYDVGDIAVLLRKNFSEKVMMSIGPAFEYFHMDSTEKNNRKRNIVQLLPGLNPNTAFAKQSYFGGLLSIAADTRDNKIIPTKGIWWQTTLRYLSGLNDASYDVTQLNSDLSFYISLIKNRLVLANRIGGGHNFGDFEFYQAQYLGSEDNLRGYRKYRFAGQSKVYNNLELRLRLANFKTYLFPGSLGLLGFYDTGRIWADIGDNDKWLSGYGGGFWISPLKRLVLTLTYTASKEDKLPLIALGWKF
jgi:hypothetical protein